jgi:hypothetical protein
MLSKGIRPNAARPSTLNACSKMSADLAILGKQRMKD